MIVFKNFKSGSVSILNFNPEDSNLFSNSGYPHQYFKLGTFRSKFFYYARRLVKLSDGVDQHSIQPLYNVMTVINSKFWLSRMSLNCANF